MLNKKVLEGMAYGHPIPDNGDSDIDSKFICPKCGGSYFGSGGLGLREYYCHDEYNCGCSWHGPAEKCFYHIYEAQTLAGELLKAYEKIEELEKK